MNKEEKREYDKEYRQKNKERISEYWKQYHQDNKEEKREYDKEYRQKNKERISKQMKLYFQTPMGRAARLLGTYNIADKKRGRGKGDLSAKWIVENIFSKPCAYCGKSGWEVIGCNRIDNSKPHSKDNVEPCCKQCNDKLATEQKKTDLAKQVFQYSLDGKLVGIWPSTKECGRNGFHTGAVSACCRKCFNREGNDIYKGYKWSYSPL